ncbi:hypothetical protein BRADI_1g42873v3 [Brachypodium distachyon]|uniref:Uncharacterized protein n=1 Tax=Brachypodium distachyon TaxID=15368 RepID=A0A0Q3S0J8_BRADI|nr:hypothetical protein BRADI_1g42873v3 [Brachypodium distachyon]
MNSPVVPSTASSMEKQEEEDRGARALPYPRQGATIAPRFFLPPPPASTGRGGLERRGGAGRGGAMGFRGGAMGQGRGTSRPGEEGAVTLHPSVCPVDPLPCRFMVVEVVAVWRGGEGQVVAAPWGFVVAPWGRGGAHRPLERKGGAHRHTAAGHMKKPRRQPERKARIGVTRKSNRQKACKLKQQIQPRSVSDSCSSTCSSQLRKNGESSTAASMRETHHWTTSEELFLLDPLATGPNAMAEREKFMANKRVYCNSAAAELNERFGNTNGYVPVTQPKANSLKDAAELQCKNWEKKHADLAQESAANTHDSSGIT